jgi:hypothetical protein
MNAGPLVITTKHLLAAEKISSSIDAELVIYIGEKIVVSASHPPLEFSRGAIDIKKNDLHTKSELN